MKKLMFYILLMVIGEFAFAVGNTHPHGSAAWHNHNNNMLWAQLEYDKQKREQAQQKSQLPPRQLMQNYINRSVFVWNDETAKAFYLPCEQEEEGWGAKKALVNKAKKIFFEVHGEKPNRHIDWECSFAVITMGIGNKSGKIEAFVDNDIRKWVKKYGGDNPDFKIKVEKDALDYCESQAYNCELIYELGDFGEK